MATMVRLLSQVDGIIEDTYRRKNEAEENRELEYKSIVRIQAWYRATVTRAYLKHLFRLATTIQRTWRGFLGRRYFRGLVKDRVFQMKLNHYNAMATKVQKYWRGFYTRKYVFNYYSRKRYLEALQLKNQQVRSDLQEFAEQQQAIERRQKEIAERQQREHLARKTHHLVSTIAMPGIYNSPFRPYPMDMEYLLQSVKPLPVEKKSSPEHSYDPSWKGYNLPRPQQLPPLPQKPQGPFREPADVQKQRYKPFQQSLRVETSFTSLEQARQALKNKEWVDRVNDDIFMPFSKGTDQYQPLLHSSSMYGHIPYGTKYFREEHIDKFVVKQNFKSLVPPIPIFEKLNDTYSRGQV
ncbi:spermatogenesis-associated protein 17-like [Liolophura sinensis]|uniref:spermatogenesis-associated protein 17-like n=1 Tax=Liolophura sinensis TaxID=3198878 RepID=UPI0031585491